MSLRTRLEAIEAAIAKQLGNDEVKFMWRDTGETEEQARQRAGLMDWPGQVLCFSWMEATH